MSGLQEADDIRSLLLDAVKHYSSRSQVRYSDRPDVFKKPHLEASVSRADQHKLVIKEIGVVSSPRVSLLRLPHSGFTPPSSLSTLWF